MWTSYTVMARTEVDLDLCIITAQKRSLGQGSIFTSVCQEFCSQGREYLGRYTPLPGRYPPPPHTGTRYTPRAGNPRTRHTPRDQVHPPDTGEIRATSGRYASYWNAFLLKIVTAVMIFCQFQLM